jgi:hypothetical protein
MILGIDPGVKTGVASYTGGRLVGLETIGPADYVSLLSDRQPSLVVIEDSRLTSFVFTGARQSHRPSLKIARNIGMVDGFCHLLFALCESQGIDVIGVSPEGKGRKLKAPMFCQMTGHTGTSNQHERDAAMVAWPHRHKRPISPGQHTL